MNDEIGCTLDDPQDSTITCQVEPGKWIIKISKKGFKFNHIDYPNATANTFAQAFVDILEMNYDVTMEKRKVSDEVV